MSNSKSGGISLLGAVFIVFLILKLANVGTVATWSWWWITAPLWMPICLILVVVIVFAFIGILVK